MYVPAQPEPPELLCADGSVRQYLRDSTDELHARLESLPIFSPVLAGTAGTADVIRLLVGYHAFHTSASLNLEIGYRELGRMGVHAPAHAPLALLAGDLLALGGTLPVHIAMERPGARPEAAGWVWVVEGSMLGSRVIHRALDSLFGPHLEGRRFFQPMPDSGVRWRAVCSSIEMYGRGQDALGCMAEGARQAFACMERSLTHAYREFLK
ncbi:biliverdin-producing heme oxygenase [Frateuria sp. MAH-13]|uniref:Biliverdin-producing heme oxygenase n=1 Tax=Frateuria flava TaxID=2821489 RepID=A0ABS4DJC1_9GAMM|nr:biliverdin-producing heme oxygenase [Frateuria flava]MBP1473140.1 biliverdin-producing heme oxygenase [Frateuria flava]